MCIYRRAQSMCTRAPARRRVANAEETRRRVGAMSDFGTAESVASFTRTPRRRRRRTRAQTRGRPSCRRTLVLGWVPSGSLWRGIGPRSTIMIQNQIRRHPRNQSRHSASRIGRCRRIVRWSTCWSSESRNPRRRRTLPRPQSLTLCMSVRLHPFQ